MPELEQIKYWVRKLGLQPMELIKCPNCQGTNITIEECDVYHKVPHDYDHLYCHDCYASFKDAKTMVCHFCGKYKTPSKMTCTVDLDLDAHDPVWECTLCVAKENYKTLEKIRKEQHLLIYGTLDSYKSKTFRYPSYSIDSKLKPKSL
jgi:hypothetical protein